MIKTFRFIFIGIVCCVLLWNNTIAQKTLDDLKAVEQEISAVFLQQTGDEYLVAAFNKEVFATLDFGFEDPDQVFSEGYLFSTWGPINKSSFNRYAFVGIYRSGTIIWQSEKEIPLKAATDTDILGVLDMNNDGNVEIITQWEYGMRGGSTGLWIYSWNGSSGVRINPVNDEGRSTLKLKDYSIDIVDFEPDRIKEIIGEDWSGEPVTYSWDGVEFSDQNKIRPDQLPRNVLYANVKSVIEKSGSKYFYSYTVINSNESVQSIEDFVLENHAEKPALVLSPFDWEFSPNIPDDLISWSIKFPVEYHRESLIQPNKISDSLKFLSNGIPRVASFYLQGNNGDYGIVRPEGLKLNSFSGYTLGPWLPDSSMSLIDFSDTLETFRFRSCEELDWATDATVCGQLENELSQVKTALLAEDSLAAANALQRFIDLVEAEKEASLTSEGYALMYFNAQYLKKRTGSNS